MNIRRIAERFTIFALGAILAATMNRVRNMKNRNSTTKKAKRSPPGHRANTLSTRSEGDWPGDWQSATSRGLQPPKRGLPEPPPKDRTIVTCPDCKSQLQLEEENGSWSSRCENCDYSAIAFESRKALLRAVKKRSRF